MTREEAIKTLKETYCGNRAFCELFKVDRCLKTDCEIYHAIKTLEDEPTKHGRWIKNEDRSGWHCSCCGKDDLYAYPYAENNERELQDFYCPNCGTRMDSPTQKSVSKALDALDEVEE